MDSNLEQEIQSNAALLDNIRASFDLPKPPPELLSPVILAYLGDAVYEVVTRMIVATSENRPINAINKDNRQLVNAVTQARLAEILASEFDYEEAAQYKRGRNAKTQSSAKNASIHDYRKATGLEAVIGYLYLKGRNARITYLLSMGMNALDSGSRSIHPKDLKGAVKTDTRNDNAES